MTAVDYIEDESLIPVDKIIVALTNKGYIKRVQNDTFKVQNRGGVGIKGMTTNEEDYLEKMITMKTHDYILFFSNYGKIYRMKGYKIPEFSRQSKGLPIINLLPLEKDEKITSMISVNDEDPDQYLTFVTKKGLIKRTHRKEFENIRTNGKKAIVLKEDDELISVNKTDGNKEIIIGASNGKAIRFNENEVRVMGRGSSGVKGIELNDDEIVVGSVIVEGNEDILIVTENGYGKKTPVDDYRITHRGTKGVKTLNITEKNGNLVALRAVYGDRDLVMITNSGMTIRISLDQISQLSRNTQGVRLMNLKDDQKVSTITLIDKKEEEEVLDTENSEE